MAHFNFKISCVPPSWIIMICNGCSIVLYRRTKGKSKHFKMAAPNKFQSRNDFSIKNAIISNKFSCNYYFLLLKVIFMQEWSFYALNTNTNFYWTEKRNQQRGSIWSWANSWNYCRCMIFQLTLNLWTFV